ncbi:MAG: hypothetical protein U0797_07380 [Gemmataceae bacterium]
MTRAARSARGTARRTSCCLVSLRDLGRAEEVKPCEDHLAALKAEDAVGGPLKLRARDNPADVDVRWRLWQWSARNGLIDEGIAWLTEILKREPRHPKANAALAEFFQKAGQPRRAALHRTAAGQPAGTKETRP